MVLHRTSSPTAYSKIARKTLKTIIRIVVAKILKITKQDKETTSIKERHRKNFFNMPSPHYILNYG
jgi:hypothetical protein